MTKEICKFLLHPLPSSPKGLDPLLWLAWSFYPSYNWDRVGSGNRVLCTARHVPSTITDAEQKNHYGRHPNLPFEDPAGGRAQTQQSTPQRRWRQNHNTRPASAGTMPHVGHVTMTLRPSSSGQDVSGLLFSSSDLLNRKKCASRAASPSRTRDRGFSNPHP